MSDATLSPFNRRYLERQLAYRIQEFRHGGMSSATVKRREALGEELDGGDRVTSRKRAAQSDRTPRV